MVYFQPQSTRLVFYLLCHHICMYVHRLSLFWKERIQLLRKFCFYWKYVLWLALEIFAFDVGERRQLLGEFGFSWEYALWVPIHIGCLCRRAETLVNTCILWLENGDSCLKSLFLVLNLFSIDNYIFDTFITRGWVQ